jgi:hypothetical protein
MGLSTIVICQERQDVSDSASAIVLSEAIQQFDEDEANKLYDSLENMNVSHSYDVPVYSIVANQVWGGVQLHDSSPQSMELLIPLYRHLADHVSEETETLRCVGVSGRYLDLIRDLADNKNLELEVSETETESMTTRSFAIRSVGWLFVSLFDAFVSLLLRPFFSPSDADILVKYPIFRPDTFRPIETHAEMESDSVFTLLTLSYFLRVRSVVDDQTTVIPIRCFSTISSMIESYLFFVDLLYNLLISGRLELAVVDAVEAETDVRLDETVGQLTRRAVWSNLSAYLYYGAACQIFEKEIYDSVLLTSTGPSGKALAVPAATYDVDTYCLSHSIRLQPISVNQSFYTGVFTEGSIVNHAVERKRTRFIPTGFPKHLNIYNLRDSMPSTDSTSTLLVATQPFPDMRKDFIHDVVLTLLNQTNWKVVVKIHPREETSLYHRILSECGINVDENDRLLLTDGDLYAWIGRSELLLTGNSNVGIESIILGTPAASYNPWSPDIRDPLYAKHGPVPILREPSELISLLANWDGKRERTHQESVIDELYMIRGNSIDEVANRIQTTMTNRLN